MAWAEFVHPGIGLDRERIAFIRQRIESGAQPWTTAWQCLGSASHASLDWQPTPFAHVERGAYNNPDIGSSEFSDDARAACYHAVCWAVSGKAAHAKKATEIIDAWSGTLKSVSNHDARLLIGMGGYSFCVSAELVRHTWDGWPAEKQSQFEAMLRNVWYPVIKDFYPTANGNWDASMMQVMLAMGVFLDDQEMFDRATHYYREGKGNGAIGNYFKPSGECQESGRDQAHTQMGLNFLANTCETAWIQGVDLYGALDNRLLKGFEYTAKYNLGYDVPYEPYESIQGRYHYQHISAISRGKLRPMYEQVYHHYHNRKGIDAPFSEQAVLHIRSGASRKTDHSRRNRQSRRRPSSRACLNTLMFAGKEPDTSEKSGLQDASTRDAPPSDSQE